MENPGAGDVRVIAITGGTGSFGSAFARFLLSLPDAPRVRIISRDEHKQEQLAGALGNDARVTFILGDVRDKDRMRVAFDGAGAVVHAAALKRIPQSERQTQEFVSVNVYGTEAVINAALAAGIRRALLISSDKAVAPINAYGKQKAVAESLFVHANQLGVTRGFRCAIVRGGNVWGSRGSVTEVWRDALRAGREPSIADADMTRFYLPMEAWCAFCWRALCEMHGGEIFAPKLRAWRLGDLAATFGASGSSNGLRLGDKPHEQLIAPLEVRRTLDIGWAYVVEPGEEIRQVWDYRPWYGSPLPDGFEYGSQTAERMSMDELRGLI